MTCQTCSSSRIATITAKCNDCFGVTISSNFEYSSYVLDDIGIGSSDYVEFNYCLDCGQIQGKFPLPPSKIEKEISDEQVVDFYKNHFTQGKINSSNYVFKQNIIQAAEYESYKFGVFMRHFVKIFKPCPSAKQFLEEFRSGELKLL